MRASMLLPAQLQCKLASKSVHINCCVSHDIEKIFTAAVAQRLTWSPFGCCVANLQHHKVQTKAAIHPHCTPPVLHLSFMIQHLSVSLHTANSPYHSLAHPFFPAPVTLVCMFHRTHQMSPPQVYLIVICPTLPSCMAPMQPPRCSLHVPTPTPPALCHRVASLRIISYYAPHFLHTRHPSNRDAFPPFPRYAARTAPPCRFIAPHRQTPHRHIMP